MTMPLAAIRGVRFQADAWMEGHGDRRGMEGERGSE